MKHCARWLCLLLLCAIVPRAAADNATFTVESGYTVRLICAEMSAGGQTLQNFYSDFDAYPLETVVKENPEHDEYFTYYTPTEYATWEEEARVKGQSHAQIAEQIGERESQGYHTLYDAARATRLWRREILGGGASSCLVVTLASLAAYPDGTPQYFDLYYVTLPGDVAYTYLCRGIPGVFLEDVSHSILQWIQADGVYDPEATMAPTPEPTPSPTPTPMPTSAPTPSPVPVFTTPSDLAGEWVGNIESGRGSAEFTFNTNGTFSCTVQSEKELADGLYSHMMEAAGTYAFDRGHLSITAYETWTSRAADPFLMNDEVGQYSDYYTMRYDHGAYSRSIGSLVRTGEAMIRERAITDEDWNNIWGGWTPPMPYFDSALFIPDQEVQMDQMSYITINTMPIYGLRLIRRNMQPIPTATPTPEAPDHPVSSLTGVWMQDNAFYTNEWQRPSFDVTFTADGQYTLYVMDGEYFEGVGFEVQVQELGHYQYDRGILTAVQEDGTNSALDVHGIQSRGEMGMFIYLKGKEYVLTLNPDSTIPPVADAQASPVTETQATERPRSEAAAPPKEASLTPQALTGQCAIATTYASTYLQGKKASYESAMTVDGDETTAWQFSANDVDRLSDAYLDLTFANSGSLNQLWIKNGFWRITDGLDQYIRNARVKKLEISFLYAGQTEYENAMEFTLADDKERKDWQRITFKTQSNVQAIRLRVLSIYKGSKFKKDVCVSEVQCWYVP